MEGILKSEDQRTLLQAFKFYQAVDKYAKLLNLDRADVAVFKTNIELFLHIAASYKSFAPSFIIYNIESLRNQFVYLSEICTANPNLSTDIAAELGIALSKRGKEIMMRPNWGSPSARLNQRM